MSNTYTEYWHKGKKDKAGNKKMSLPSTLPDAMKYRGYMDGYSGRESKPPEGMKIKHKPRETIN